MAIRDVVTRGYGNGTYNGSIALVVVRGYAVGAAVSVPGRRKKGRKRYILPNGQIIEATQDQVDRILVQARRVAVQQQLDASSREARKQQRRLEVAVNAIEPPSIEDEIPLSLELTPLELEDSVVELLAKRFEEEEDAVVALLLL